VGVENLEISKKPEIVSQTGIEKNRTISNESNITGKQSDIPDEEVDNLNGENMDL